MNARKSTQIMAHRGASAAAPANTVAAFVLARDMGAHAVELDVRQCATGELVVHHDPHLADGRIIAHLDKQHLPKHIPTLDEALDACGDMWVNVEVKNYFTEPDYDSGDQRTLAVLKVLRRRTAQHGDPRRYLLSCFRRKDRRARARRVARVADRVAHGVRARRARPCARLARKRPRSRASGSVASVA